MCCYRSLSLIRDRRCTCCLLWVLCVENRETQTREIEVLRRKTLTFRCVCATISTADCCATLKIDFQISFATIKLWGGSDALYKVVVHKISSNTLCQHQNRFIGFSSLCRWWNYVKLSLVLLLLYSVFISHTTQFSMHHRAPLLNSKRHCCWSMNLWRKFFSSPSFPLGCLPWQIRSNFRYQVLYCLLQVYNKFTNFRDLKRREKAGSRDMRWQRRVES